MKKLLIIFTLLFSVMFSSTSYSTELKYRIIQTWESDEIIKHRSFWKENLFLSLEQCEKAMISAIVSNDINYQIKTISILNVNNIFEERTILYKRRPDGTIQVQWGCLDFNS